MPSGVSVPHMFIVTFVIMLPITIATKDPIKGWEAGLVWVFFQSFILMIGGFVAPYIRMVTPRAALLGTLAGVSITFIAMRPALEMFMTPAIGLTCFAIIMVSWFGGYKYPKGIPAGLVAIAVGTIIAWGSNAFGLGLGGLSLAGLKSAFMGFGFSVPLPAVDHVFSGFQFLGVISLLLAIIPVVAISPILRYSGMLIGAQAFQTTPTKHAPAIVLALTPHAAAWAKTLMDGALGAAGMGYGQVHAPDFIAKMGNNGVLYQGLDIMAGGSILTGLVLAAIGVFVIDREFMKASAFALAGAVLTYFGFMHGDAVGIGHGFGVTPSVCLGYLIVAGFLFALSKQPAMVDMPAKAVPAE